MGFHFPIKQEWLSVCVLPSLGIVVRTFGSVWPHICYQLDLCIPVWWKGQRPVLVCLSSAAECESDPGCSAALLQSQCHRGDHLFYSPKPSGGCWHQHRPTGGVLPPAAQVLSMSAERPPGFSRHQRWVGGLCPAQVLVSGVLDSSAAWCLRPPQSFWRLSFLERCGPSLRTNVFLEATSSVSQHSSSARSWVANWWLLSICPASHRSHRCWVRRFHLQTLFLITPVLSRCRNNCKLMGLWILIHNPIFNYNILHFLMAYIGSIWQYFKVYI